MVPNGWKLGVISDLADTIMGYAFKSVDFTKKGIPLLRMGNLYQNALSFDRNPIYLPESFKNEYERFLVKPNDLVMSMTGTMGKRDYGFTVKIPTDAPYSLLNQRVIKFVPKHESSSGFLLNLLRSEIVLSRLYAIPGGTKQANLSAKQIQELPAPIPPLPEQRKIAKILSTWDKAISTSERLIENSKQQKKALMQQLLTGKKRLLDDSGKPFSDEWKVATFDEALTKLTDYTANGSFASLAENVTVFDEENYSLWIMGRTLKSGNYDRDVRYTDERGYEFLKKTKLFGGELLMPKTGDVGKAYLFPHLGKKATLADNVFLLDFKSIILNDFAKWFINSEKFQFELERMMYGTSQKTIVKKVLRRMHICVPSISEQIKIVSVLTRADKEIELLEQQLADLKQEKKALMQQLLTGKRRVIVDEEEVA